MNSGGRCAALSKPHDAAGNAGATSSCSSGGNATKPARIKASGKKRRIGYTNTILLGGPNAEWELPYTYKYTRIRAVAMTARPSDRTINLPKAGARIPRAPVAKRHLHRRQRTILKQSHAQQFTALRRRSDIYGNQSCNCRHASSHARCEPSKSNGEVPFNRPYMAHMRSLSLLRFIIKVQYATSKTIYVPSRCKLL